jgi:signal transduction histidine kinase
MGRDELDADRLLGATVRTLIRVLGEAGDVDSVRVTAQVLAEEGERLLGASCLISTVHPQRPDHFHGLAATGSWAEPQVGRLFPMAGTLSGRAIAEQRVIESTQAADESTAGGMLGEAHIATVRVVPLLSGRRGAGERRPLGVFAVGRSEPVAFTAPERTLIDAYAGLVAISLYRAAVQEALQESAGRFETGVRTALDMAATLDPNEVTRKLLERAVTAAGSDRATLFRVDGDELVVEMSHDRRGAPTFVGARYGHDVHDITLRVIRTRRAAVLRHPKLDNLPPAVRTAMGDVKHMAGLPLLLGGMVDGVLALFREEDRPFTTGDLDTLTLIAGIAVLALRNARLFREVQESSRTKSRFLNLAAHELRTPLTVITGYISMLGDGSLGEPSERWAVPVGIIARKSQELTDLIEDLLVTARLEAGALPSTPATIDMVEVARSAAERATPRATLLNGDVVLSLPAHTVPVHADLAQVARIVDNLVNNALTYTTRAPRAELTVHSARDGSGELVVADNGIGIPPQRDQDIFQQFTRLDELPDRAGTGLGLYIGRELAERNGGSLTLLRSSVGVGSSFLLRLPGPRMGGAAARD